MTWVNMPDAHTNLHWTVPGHTDTFRCQQSYVLGLVKPYNFTSTNRVYVAVHAQGRTTSYNVVRSVNDALYAASKAIILEHHGVCRVENLYELNTILDTIIAHRRNLLQARATPLSRSGVRDVIDHVTIWFVICHFPLVIHWNRVFISKRFQHIHANTCYRKHEHTNEPTNTTDRNTSRRRWVMCI